MKHRNLIIALSLTTGLTACASSPAGKATKMSEPSITYNLPITAVKLTAEYRLVSCEPGTQLEVEPKVTLTPVALPNPEKAHRFTVKATELRSFSKKRDLAITLHPHGAIKTINATTTDRTPDIIGGAIKAVGRVLAFSRDADGKKKSLICNQETTDALELASILENRILAERNLILNGSNPTKEARLRVDLLAAELARVEQDYLTIKLSKALLPGEPVYAPGAEIISPQFETVRWDADKIQKWLDSEITYDPRNDLAMGVCVSDAFADFTCNEEDLKDKKSDDKEFEDKEFEDKKFKKLAYAAADCKATGCRKTLVFREPKAADVTVIALSTSQLFDAGTKVEWTMPDDVPLYEYNSTKDKMPAERILARESAQISQWGKLTYHDMRVGLGGSKSLAMTLDAFGAPSSYGVKSSASGVALTSFASDTLTSLKSIADAQSGESLAEQKAEVDALTTQKKLNELRACQAIISNGGFDCSPDDS